MIEIEYHPKTGRFLLKVPFDKNGLVRNLPGRRWLKRVKKWSVPAVRANVQALMALDKEQTTWAADAMTVAEEIKESQPQPLRQIFPAYYKYATEPYKKQEEAIRQSYGMHEFAYFMGMGTGKTKVVIDVTSALWLEGRISQVIVVCPVSIQDNWREEIRIHCPIIDMEQVHVYRPQQHKKYEKWLEIINPDQIRYIIFGIESFSQGKAAGVAEEFVRYGSTYMAIDESSRIKTHDAKRTERCIDIGKNAKYRAIMTGTPVTQGPLDIYAQFEYLNTHIFGLGDYYSFRNRYAIMGGHENKEIVGYDNLDELADTVKPFIFEATLADMVDLPPKIRQVRHVQMSKEQKKILRDIAAGHATVDNVEIEIKNVLVKMLRMQQVVNGFYSEYQEDPLTGKKYRTDHNLKTNPKLDELKNLLGENSYQAIVWAKYKQDRKNIARALPGSYVVFDGDTKQENRQPVVKEFQDGNAQYFLGNAAAGGIGLTLTAARLMVYFSNSFSLEERLQSEDRAHRIGQEHPVTYVDIVGQGTVDELALEAIQNKTEIAELVRTKIREIGSQQLLSSLTG